MVAIFMTPVFSQTTLPDQMQKFYSTKSEAYFKVQVNSQEDINKLARIIPVDKVSAYEVYAYANKKEFETFLGLNLDYTLLTNPSELYRPKMYDGSKDTYEWDAYPTYEAYVAMMYQFATDYPDICQVFSIGQTVEGRELLFAKISDNVDVDEAEPQVMYTGTIHGDEVTGYVLLLRLIDYFTSNYGTDAEVTDMVNGMEIWINPAANPDGTYHGGNNTVWGATRANANGVDMNRNYIDPQYGDHPDGQAWQPETILFMQLAEDNNFILSSNFHGGTEVVNYPWDLWSRLTADDDWWQLVSHEYADTAQSFSPSNYMNNYDDGITNGYQWYQVHGGRQDFMNYFHGCREVTIELSDVKTIPESQLEDHWIYNKRSLINLLKQGYYGIRGIVTDINTGEPVDAKIEVLNHDEDQSYIYSRPGVGNYHRLLKAGTYDLVFSAGGYESVTVYDVVVNDYDSTVLNVQLGDLGLVAGFSADNTMITPGSSVQFTQESFGNPETYTWTFEGGDPATSTDENPIVTYNEIGSFDVSLVVTREGESEELIRENYISVNEEYMMANQEITTCSGVFYDDGGKNGNYSDAKDFTTTIYGDETADNYHLEVEFLDFALEPQANCNYDYLKIYNGVNNSAPLIGTYCGNNGPGTVTSDNADHALTFVFHSDNSVNDAGWTAMINCTIVEATHELANEFFHIYPNPINEGLLIIKSEISIEEVQLTNLNGQIIFSKVGKGKKETIDTTGLNAGIYVLMIQTKSGINYQKIQVL